MSPVSLTLDLLLAALLLITLGFGLRLDKRLKALNASQATFAAAVADLDQAAARAESGLADLRVAMDEAVGLLAGRIEKARELAAKLESLTSEAAAVVAQRPAPAAAAPANGAAAGRRSALDRLWTRPTQPQAARDEAPLTLTRDDALPRPRPASAPSAARSRAAVDDELFDGPAPRRVAGGRS